MRSPLGSIGKYLRLPSEHRRTLTRALLMTPRVKFLLRDRGYQQTLAWLDSKEPPRLQSTEAPPLAKKIDYAIRTLPWSMHCLERSLVVRWVVGDDAVVKLGVSPGADGQPHRFHAWVELGGVPLNDYDDIASEFLPLSGDRLGSAEPKLFE